MNDEKIIKNRLCELSERAFQRNYNTFSEFLNMDEISTLKSLKLNSVYKLYGGYENAERCVAGFGTDIEEWEYPIRCIKVSPLQQKFADKLTHRDFLGALMNLGINRNTIGDIVVNNNEGYIFSLNTIEQYIKDNITRIKHTTVQCETIEQMPEFVNGVLESEEIIISSARVDAVVSAVYKLSRNQSNVLFEQEKVYINSRKITKESTTVAENDVVSVRGYGKFIFAGTLRKTKKDRLVAEIKIYK